MVLIYELPSFKHMRLNSMPQWLQSEIADVRGDLERVKIERDESLEILNDDLKRVKADYQSALDNLRVDLERAKQEKEADMRVVKEDMKKVKEEKDKVS